MGFLGNLFGPSRDEIWAQLAGQIGGQFQDGGFLGRDRVVARAGEWIVTLDTYTTSSGGAGRNSASHTTTWTRLRAPYVNADGFKFKIYRQGLFSELGKLLGMQDIVVGFPDFDQQFVIKANSEPKVRELLADERLRMLLQGQYRGQLEVKDDDGFFGTSFPQGVDQLVFEAPEDIRNLPQLRSLFDLFAATLDQLCRIGSAYRNDPGVRV